MSEMMDIFNYDFIRRSFYVGTLLAVIVPCIGITIVLRRLSMIGETLAHTSLAGVTFGLLLGYNPTFCATAYCVLAALGIEYLRHKVPQYSELSIAIVLSVGIGLTGLMSGFVKNATDFQSFLFGSIMAIPDGEFWMVVGVSAAVLTTFLLLYKELFYIAFDETAARMAGVPVNAVNFIFTILTAVTISVAARTVGALIVSSLLVIPVAASMQLGKSYRTTLICAISFSVLTTVLGLYASCFWGTKPGGTIVLLEVVILILVLFWRGIRRKI